jgi:mutator protein MutT
MRKPKVLLTGFEPFDGASFNISEKIVSKMKDLELGEISLETNVLTVNEKGSHFVSEKLIKNKYDCVLMLGYSNKIEKINVESRAVNRIHMDIKDNSGRKIDESQVISLGLGEYKSTISVENLLNSCPIEFIISSDAGSFVCNETYYRTLHKIYSENVLDQFGRSLPCVFIHIPLEKFEPIHNQIKFILWLIKQITFQNVLDVVAAIIRNKNGEILVAKRKFDQPHPGKWEFPGGKLIPHETDAEGLKREINEELNLDIKITSVCGEITHQYSDYFVKLKALNATISLNSPSMELSVHDEILWLPVERLPSLDFLEANLKLLKIIQNQS